MVIIIAGMIGAGKTTLAELIGKELGTDVFYEPVETNTLLEPFYKDPKRWAFALQIDFLNKRFRSIKQALKHKNNVLDRSIYEDVIFTRINHERGNMSDVELAIYLDLFENMMEQIETVERGRPDLLLFLNGSFQTILNHIKKRGRPYEQDPSLIDYYRELYEKYQEWIKTYDKSPVLIIDVDKHDLTQPVHSETVLRLVKEKLAQLESDKF